MKSLSKNSQGVGFLPLLIVLFVLSGIAVAGWYVKTQQGKPQEDKASNTSNNTSENSNQDEGTTAYTPPEGWVKYEDDKLEYSFYYPSTWSMGDFEIISTVLSSTVPMGLATSGSLKAETSKNTWQTYDNFGTQHQEGPYDIPTSWQKRDVEGGLPILFFETGEGGSTTHFIFLASKTKINSIRLPLLNEETVPDSAEWGTKVKEQQDSIKQVVESIQFNS